MKYAPPIRGKVLKESVAPQPSPFQMTNDFGSVANLVYELRMLREDIVNTVDKELDRIDTAIEEAYNMKEGPQGPAGIDADEQKIADWVLSQLRQPEDGKDGDPQKIVPEVIKEVLSRLPPMPNEADIIAKVVKQIPSPKASLKVIREEMQLDKEELLEEILKSPKLKLKIGNVDGLETTLKALDRRYIHGGGFSNIADATSTVATGLDTLKFTGSGVSSVVKTGNTVVVTITGGSGTFTLLTATGTIDDSNVTFTMSGTPTVMVINGQSWNAGATSGGVVVWTNVGAVVTLANPVGIGGAIFGFSS